MNQTETQRVAFELFAKRHMNRIIGDCFLRDCNNVEPDRTYEKFETEAAWSDWQVAQSQPSVAKDVVERLTALKTAFEARCTDKYTKEEVNGKVCGAVDAAIGIVRKSLITTLPPTQADVESDERKFPTEAERSQKWKALTNHLPPLVDEPEIWCWSEQEIAMLRAACAKRFGETLRTESLFCIASTGIRIAKSRLTNPAPKQEDVDLNEADHMESCGCCQAFLKMEAEYDALKKTLTTASSNAIERVAIEVQDKLQFLQPAMHESKLWDNSVLIARAAIAAMQNGGK